MKFSMDGRRMVNVFNGSKRVAEVFNFNNQTGLVESLFLRIPFNVGYGAEFSPSGRYLYLSSLIRPSQPFNQTQGQIIRFDLSSMDPIGNQESISASSNSFGSMELAVDGKIYVAQETSSSQPFRSLSVIEKPDRVFSEIQFRKDAVSVSPNGSGIGLPPRIPFAKKSTTFTHNLSCINDSYQFFIKSNQPDGSQFFLELPDGTSVNFKDSLTVTAPIRKTCKFVVFDYFGVPLDTIIGTTDCGFIFPGEQYVGCDRIFIDDNEGPNGKYSANKNTQTKICSSNGGRVELTFNMFELELNGGQGDQFEILDQSGVTLYNSQFSYPSLVPTVVTSNAGSVCLTINFRSDQNGQEGRGWRAIVACKQPVTPPCQPFACSGNTDNCSTTCSLPLTPIQDCSQNPNDQSVNSFCLNNIGATPSTPYLNQSDCFPNDGITPLPASDVWYRVTAVSNSMRLLITNSTLEKVNLVLYRGECDSLVGKSCAVGSGGGLYLEVNNLTVGEDYRIQISGARINDRGNFQLTITNFNRCTACQILSTLTANPPPVNGRYSPGQKVDFTYKVTYWDPVANDNWLHSVIPVFGSGWDINSLTYTLPSPCGQNGQWVYSNKEVTSTANGRIFPPGFYFESTVTGNGTTSDPNNPGDNWGDGGGQCSNGFIPDSEFIFQFSLIVDECPRNLVGSNLNVLVNLYGDYQSGSYTTNTCEIDSPNEFTANGTCCVPAEVKTLVPAKCPTACNGSAVIEGRGNAPFRMVWKDGNDVVVRDQSGVIFSDTLKNACPGFYVVDVTDAGGCLSTVFFEVTADDAPEFVIQGPDTICSGDSLQLTAIFTGEGPFTLDFSIDGGLRKLVSVNDTLVFSSLPGSTQNLNFGPLFDAGKNCSVPDVTNRSIVLNNLPQGLLFGIDSVCGADSAFLSINAAGVPPMQLRISNGTDTLPFTVSPGTTQLAFTTQQSADWNLVSLVDNSSPKGCVAKQLSSSAKVIWNPNPEVQLFAVDSACQNEPLIVQLGFSGTLPASVTLTNGTFSKQKTIQAPFDTTTIGFNVGLNAISYQVAVDATRCKAVAFDTVKTVGIASPTASMSGSYTTCEGVNFSFPINCTGIAPFTVYLSDNSGRNYVYPNLKSGVNMVSFPGTLDTLILRIDSVTDGSIASCTGSGSGSVNLLVLPAPIFTLLPSDPKLCVDSTVNLSFSYSGINPYSVRFSSPDSVYQFTNISGSQSISLSLDTTTTFNILEVTDGRPQRCKAVVLNSIRVEVFEPLQAVLLKEACLTDFSAFSAEVEVTGGDPLTYTANGIAFTGSQYASPLIPNGSSYTIVFDDATNCPTAIVEDKKYCECISEAGRMSLAPVQVCVGDSVLLPQVPVGEAEVGDTVIYVLHDRAGISLGNVFASNSSPRFAFNPSTMVAGRFYYVSQLVGDAKMTDPFGFDPLDTCIDVSRGTPVRWNALPTAAIDGDATICVGTSTPLTIQATGRAPFVLNVSVNGQDTSYALNALTTVLSVSPFDSTTYLLRSITDGNTPVCSSLLNDSARIRVNQLPTAAISGNAVICE
ncbi:MAG TPA: hypothetical protein VFV37_06360, partial [Luteibaculaceae bacterium]|nr:hypothetical protein [Luteibaculaceae bacterium]